MHTRIFTQEDQARIVEIYNHAVDEKFATADTKHITIESRENWFSLHSPDSYPIFVAENEKDMTGWCSLSPYRPGRMALRSVAEISYYVHKAYRKQGIANSLIKHALNSAVELDFKNLISILLDVNKPSIYLLEKFGFEKWGHLPDIALIDGVVCGQFIYGKKL
jgi:L-amino acid N-acyltransferase YncA